jgi:hypothetical protein
MKTTTKQRLLIALLLMSLYTGLAQAWTFTTSGLITSGYDSTGVFGTANQDLTGLAYTQSLTLDPAQYIYQYTDAYTQYGDGNLLAGTATDTVTVNGLTHSYLFDLTQSNWGEAYLSNGLTQGGGSGYNYDEAYQYHYGVTTDGQSIYSLGSVYSFYNPLNIGLSYTQSWFGIGGSIIARESVSQAYFEGTPSLISINAVPEPEGLMLLALGLIGLAGMHRKFSLKT